MPTISHILAAENTKLEHLAWTQFRREIGMEIPADRLRAKINVTGLHAIVHLDDTTFCHIWFVALQGIDCRRIHQCDEQVAPRQADSYSLLAPVTKVEFQVRFVIINSKLEKSNTPFTRLTQRRNVLSAFALAYKWKVRYD